MLDQLIKYTPGLAPWVALLVAIITGTFGVRGFRLARRIQDDLRRDEVLVAGRLQRPRLNHIDHEKSVLWTTLFNRGKSGRPSSKMSALMTIGCRRSPSLGPAESTPSAIR